MFLNGLWPCEALYPLQLNKQINGFNFVKPCTPTHVPDTLKTQCFILLLHHKVPSTGCPNWSLQLLFCALSGTYILTTHTTFHSDSVRSLLSGNNHSSPLDWTPPQSHSVDTATRPCPGSLWIEHCPSSTWLTLQHGWTQTSWLFTYPGLDSLLLLCSFTVPVKTALWCPCQSHAHCELSPLRHPFFPAGVALACSLHPSPFRSWDHWILSGISWHGCSVSHQVSLDSVFEKTTDLGIRAPSYMRLHMLVLKPMHW